jgi:glycogen synthase
VFEQPTVDSLIRACEAAFRRYEAGGPMWDGLLDRAMAVDFDWVRGSAPDYLDAYRRAIEIRRRSPG